MNFANKGIMGVIFRKFDSVGQFSHYLNTSEVSPIFKGCSLDSRNASKSFTGTESYECADELLLRGDREGMEIVRKTISATPSLKGSGECQKKKFFNDIAGFMPHVPNYLAGVPQQMINSKVVRYKNSKVLNIVYNCAVHCGISADDMRKAALKILSFVNKAERNGYRVNLYVLNACYLGDEELVLLVRIKDSNNYVDLLKMVYPMTHPSWLRRHIFAFIEKCPELHNRKWVGSYGYVEENEEKIKSNLAKSNIKVDYYFSYYNTNHGKEIKYEL